MTPSVMRPGYRPTGALSPLPVGISTLSVAAAGAFGAASPTVTLSGRVSSTNVVVVAGAPVVDQSSRTIRIKVSTTKRSSSVQGVKAMSVPFSKTIPLSQLAGKTGTWSVHILDSQGQICGQTSLSLFNRV